MNPEAQELFNSLLAKEVEALQDPEIEFLYARRGYIKKDQRGAYKEVFEEVEKRVKKKLQDEKPNLGNETVNQEDGKPSK